MAWQSSGGSGGGRRSMERPRRFSFAVRRGSGFSEDGEEEDGDLGYAAVGESEGSRRKVIVERIEMVKSKRPFFTWC
jgi:phosphatidylinositol 4-kinase type 2